ncbi:MAG TPA: hypothetical protein VFR95_14110 [Gemmatimonadaceae bacterium]|nr:hypothetical protein [Gemmatimonadaceae bacterium]
MSDDSVRASVLRAHGARGGEVDELLAYARCTFVVPEPTSLLAAPPDEPFVAVWEQYAREAREIGAAQCLRRRLVQLRFPIAAGISKTAAYHAATRRGDCGAIPDDGGVSFERPDELRILVHPTAAGRIPVIVAGARSDFVSLVRALVHRNEPADVPSSMGACIVAGYNNWDRIATLRARWREEQGSDVVESGWSDELRRTAPLTERYQDRFILLSSGPYSAVPASAMGLDESEWMELSLTVRLEHECAHYVTRRMLGSMRNSILDEIIADYMGIVAAAGRYRADWFLRFMGLERFPLYRSGGRLENYRGDPVLSDGAFRVLGSLVVAAAAQLERFDARRSSAAWGCVLAASTIFALATLGLEELASPKGAELLGAIVRDSERKAVAGMTTA